MKNPLRRVFFAWRPGEKQQFDPYRQSTLDDDAHHPVAQIAKLIFANSRAYETHP
jgi:hypothetical protein